MNVSRTVIYDVVFQYAGGSAQFSACSQTGESTVWRITEDTIQAVDQALEGEDYSQGALFSWLVRVPTAAAWNGLTVN